MSVRLASGPVPSPPPVKEYSTEWLEARADAKTVTENAAASITVPTRLKIIDIASPLALLSVQARSRQRKIAIRHRRERGTFRNYLAASPYHKVYLLHHPFPDRIVPPPSFIAVVDA